MRLIVCTATLRFSPALPRPRRLDKLPAVNDAAGVSPKQKKSNRNRSANAAKPPVVVSANNRRWRVVSIAIIAIAAVVVLIVRPHFRGKQISQLSPVARIAAEDALPDQQVFAAYAGSSSCRSCHERAYESWSNSHHGLAERPVRGDLDSAAFHPSEHAGAEPTTRLVNNVSQIAALGLSGKVESFPVQRVIGHDPLRQFLVAAAGGRSQVLETAYDPHRNDWFDVFGNENRQPGEWGHWTGRGMTWNSMCATCHNTRLRKNYDEAADTYHTTMAEISVGCESCHGPMKPHVDWQAANKGHAATPPTSDPMIKHFSRDQMLDTCGSCHSRRAELTGDFVPGESYFDHFALETVDSSDAFYADGQVRDEDYELTAFSGSRMHAAGVRCVDCHDPHSSKTILPGNALCLRCHSAGLLNAPRVEPAAHTFHNADSAGSQCVNCHMPQTTYMQRHARHDHGFTTPDPLLTSQLGIPNACNRCHADKDAAWAQTAAERWYGAKLDRPARRRAVAIAAGRRGDESAKASLAALLQDPKETWYWKSVASGLLGRWAGESTISAMLIEELRHEHPMVRASAARALSEGGTPSPNISASLQPLLSDPARQVRVTAADILAGTTSNADPTSRAGRDLLLSLSQVADQPLGQLHRAGYELARHDPTEAATHVEKAIAWDPHSAAMRREAAVLYGMMARPQEALAAMESACRLDPTNAGYAYLLGLAFAEAGQPERTIAALERAVQLDPHHSRAWYNLGLARNSMGQFDSALIALSHAEASDAADPDIPYASATILLRLNRLDEARATARRALKIRDYPPAENLLKQLR